MSDDIRRDIWDKMVFLSTFAGLTSLLRLPIGPIRGDPETRRLLRDGLAEAVAVARAARRRPARGPGRAAARSRSTGCPPR